MKPNIRVLLADDHVLLRTGVEAVISAEPDIEVVAQASNGREAIELFRTHRPDVTLMDLRMPEFGGLQAISAIRSEFPKARILVLTTYSGDVSAMRALRAGAVGYLLKGTLRTELIDAIRVVHEGGRRIPAEVAMALARHYTDDALTEREIQVLRLVAAGNSNKRVGDHFNVSEGTVKTHMKSILDKLDANDRTHAVAIAVQRGILEL